MNLGAPFIHKKSYAPMIAHAFQHHGIIAASHPKTHRAIRLVLPAVVPSALLELVKSYPLIHSVLEFGDSFHHISPTELPLFH